MYKATIYAAYSKTKTKEKCLEKIKITYPEQRVLFHL